MLVFVHEIGQGNTFFVVLSQYPLETETFPYQVTPIILLRIGLCVFMCVSLPVLPSLNHLHQQLFVPATSKDQYKISNSTPLIARRLFCVPAVVGTFCFSVETQQCHYTLFNMTKFPSGNEAPTGMLKT